MLNSYELKILSLIAEIEKKPCISTAVPFTALEARKIWHKHRLKHLMPLKGFKDNLNYVACPFTVIQKDMSQIFKDIKFPKLPIIKFKRGFND